MTIAELQIATLEVKLSGPRDGMPECTRTIETQTDTTLDELHGIIQDVVNFDDDHMYLFFLGPRWNKQTSETGTAARLEDPVLYSQLTLADIFPLEKRIKLFYLFDLGDRWYFEIACRSVFKPIAKRCKYPRVVAKVGRNPKQYG
jgi:hypothetical protein